MYDFLKSPKLHNMPNFRNDNLSQNFVLYLKKFLF